MSQTIWAGQDGAARDPLGGQVIQPGPAAGPGGLFEPVGAGVSVGVGAGGLARASARGDEVAVAEPLVDVRDIAWELPSAALLEIRALPTGGGQMDHDENSADIEKKLRSFGIEAKVVAVNSGPVVTQYEVRPDARVKISRIEGLADDLAMALDGPLDPDRGADPGQGRGRHRDPERQERDRRLPHARRGHPHAVRDEPADLRPRPRRVRARRTPSTWPRCPTCSSPGRPARARASASTP